MRYQIKLSLHSAFLDFKYKGRLHTSLSLALLADTDARTHQVETFRLIEQIETVEVGYDTFRNSQFLHGGDVSYWNWARTMISNKVLEAVDAGKPYTVDLDICFDLYGRYVERDDSNENSIWFSINFQLASVDLSSFHEMKEMEEDLIQP